MTTQKTGMKTHAARKRQQRHLLSPASATTEAILIRAEVEYLDEVRHQPERSGALQNHGYAPNAQYTLLSSIRPCLKLRS